MKKLAALILICMLFVSTAYAAEWTDGRSAAQPYAGVPEVNLDETMGYIMLFPRAKMPAQSYCDVLEIYLPREDLVLGEGSLTLCNAEGELEKISFADSERVELRPLEEPELEGLMWGGGMCIEVHLIKSLSFDENYYILMDDGCFTAAEGKLQSLAITSNEAWVPVITGDYGIGGLFYSAAPEQPVEEQPTEEELAEEEETEEPEPTEAPTEAPAEEEVPAEPKAPEKGDIITFDLKMGGDAKYAVVFSENDSVSFDPPEYTESGRIKGAITGDELDWGVVFLDENGDVLEVLDLG